MSSKWKEVDVRTGHISRLLPRLNYPRLLLVELLLTSYAYHWGNITLGIYPLELLLAAAYDRVTWGMQPPLSFLV